MSIENKRGFSMSENSTEIVDALRHISPQAFKDLGKEGLFYVRPIYIEGNMAYALYNAAGEQISIFPDEKTAIHAAWHNDVQTVTLH